MTEPRSSPIFIVGNPRSGTTLLRLLLASHPKLAIPPECGFAIWLRPEFAEWTLAESTCDRSVQRFVWALERCRKFDSWDLPGDVVTATIAARMPSDYAELVAAVYWSFAARHKPTATRWGDKNNFHTRHVLDLDRLFPHCQFVHIVRDVRDVACSYLDMDRLTSDNQYRPRLPADVQAISADWLANVGAVEAAFERLPSGRARTLRYEDLVRHPDETLRTLCAFLDESYESVMLEFHRLNLEPTHTLEWKLKTLEPLAADRVGRHRAELPAGDVEALTDLCRTALDRYHYLD